MAEKLYHVTEETKAKIEWLFQVISNLSGPNVKQTPWGPAFKPQPSARKPAPARIQPPTTIIKITSATSPSVIGGGAYWGRVQKRKADTTIDPTIATLALSTYYEDESTDNVIVINLAENGFTTHGMLLPANSRFPCFSAGEVTATNHAIFYTWAFGLVVCS